MIKDTILQINIMNGKVLRRFQKKPSFKDWCREVPERRRGGCINGRAIKVHDLSGLEKQLEGKMKVGIHHDSKIN